MMRLLMRDRTNSHLVTEVLVKQQPDALETRAPNESPQMSSENLCGSLIFINIKKVKKYISNEEGTVHFSWTHRHVREP